MPQDVAELVAAAKHGDREAFDELVRVTYADTYTLAYRRMPNYKMVEFVCENNREYLDEKGAVKMKLRER